MEVARSGYWASAFHVFVSQTYQDFVPCKFGTNTVFAIFAFDFLLVVFVCMIFAPSKSIFLKWLILVPGGILWISIDGDDRRGVKNP